MLLTVSESYAGTFGGAEDLSHIHICMCDFMHKRETDREVAEGKLLIAHTLHCLSSPVPHLPRASPNLIIPDHSVELAPTYYRRKLK